MVDVMDGRYQVNTITFTPEDQRALLVLGHGAGAGMEHRFMEQLAGNLAGNAIGTTRYNFPYIEQGRRSPTSPAISEATIQAVVDSVSPPNKIPLLVGGKSYGGRMSSQAQSKQMLPGVSGLVFFGFPLHAPGKPSADRGEHLKSIDIPMLFLQGSRDKLAELDLLRPLLNSLNAPVTLQVLEGADHSFNMLKSAETTSEQALQKLAVLTAEWVTDL